MKTCLTSIVMVLVAVVANAREPNYDESKVALYTLEDPLAFADGRKLKDASEWPARRKEILEIFAREMYGEEPPAPEAVVTELREEGSTLAGLAIRRQYRMWFKQDKSGPFLDWLLVLPNRVAELLPNTKGAHVVCENREKVPAVLMLNYPGNHAVLNDAEVALPEGGWFDAKGEWLSCRAASPVWEFLGKEGLPKGDSPDNYDLSCVGSSFGYVRRGGQHGLAGYDWLWMLDFADKALRK